MSRWLRLYQGENRQLAEILRGVGSLANLCAIRVHVFFRVGMVNKTLANGNTHSDNTKWRESSYQLPGTQVRYPIDAFPDIIRQAVIDVDAVLGGGVELAASAALGAVSLVCQEFVNVRRPPDLPPTSCSLFLITIAGTGAGKSEIQRRFMTAVEAFEREDAARAKSASADYKDLSNRDRLAQLRVLRAEREEILSDYDALREQYEALEKTTKRVSIEVRSKRQFNVGRDAAEHLREQQQAKHQAEVEREQAKQQARDEMRALEPQLENIQKKLAEVGQKIRSAMGSTARRLVYGRGSFAGFRNGLQDMCRAAGIISAEAGGILNSPMLTRNMDAWNDLWGIEFYRETYDKREYVIDSPRLTLALMLQPKQFEKFIDTHGENALDNGFLSRTLLLKVPSQPVKLIEESDEADAGIAGLDEFNRRISQILNQDFPWISERSVLKLAKSARRLWGDYYNTLMTALDIGRLDPAMEGFVRKLPEQAARIAGLFHYFKHYPITTVEKIDSSTGIVTPLNDEIPEETMRAAIRLCDWYMAEFKKLIVSHHLPEEFSSWVYSTQVKTNADKIYQTIQRNYRKYEKKQESSCVRLLYRDIQNGNRAISNRADIVAALRYLAVEGRVNMGSGPNGGTFICFNPYHTYCCGRCDDPTSVQTGSVPMQAVNNPVPVTPTATQSDSHVDPSTGEIIEGPPAVGGSSDRSNGKGSGESDVRVDPESWPTSDDGFPVQSLLEAMQDSNPGLFFKRNAIPETDTAFESDSADDARLESAKSTSGGNSVEMDEIAELRLAELRESMKGRDSNPEQRLERDDPDDEAK